ncbi:nuclear transport factor 2 family protein [Pontibacter sp. BT731]|uniref:nuclear transport factor 2 family protein n=1 Tax=Pontibacter coccineus TaxID=3063328 RepID=UPI0026E42860|nr:nuclear transport factor 2 family protein [Pontibacter sp. BT731]MDO6389077.1 nuclear transport factor 2 family protein [Pontibacter sp. BT731]
MSQSKPEIPAVVKPVELQLKGYNNRDIDLFASAFSDTVKVYRQPGVLTYQGRNELHKRYGAMFASTPDLHCEIVNRIVAGDVVIDQEKVQRKKGEPRTDAIAVYRVKDGLIVEVTFIPPHNQ